MEGEKERLRQHRDEKESNEADDYGKYDDDKDKVEEDGEDLVGAALVWQERYGEDNLGLPIMHWEALSLRIAELEKQEEEKKEKRLKVRCCSVLLKDGVCVHADFGDCRGVSDDGIHRRPSLNPRERECKIESTYLKSFTCRLIRPVQ